MSTNFKARHKSRRYALQALYGWSMTGNNLTEVEHYFLAGKNLTKIDVDYFHALLHKIPQQLEQIDALLAPHVSRALAEIDPIELMILRIATYELQAHIDVPYKVIINEAVELSKVFGATDSHKFINGIVDKIARMLRTQEL